MRSHVYQVLIILILGTCYFLTVSRDLSWAHFSADGGDLISAVVTGGVPHPSGYPLYLALASPFQWLPFGTPAFRANLFSAACTIVAALTLYAFLARVLPAHTHTRYTAFLGALTYGTLPLVWGQAVVTEVYALHGLMVLACFYVFIWDDSPRRTWATGLVFGLASANHLTCLFLFPLLALDLDAKIFVSPAGFLRRGLGVIAGWSLYILLPLRAASNPPVNWGNPSTLAGFIWLVSGRAYQAYAFSLSYADMLGRLRAASHFFIGQFTAVGALLVIYGALLRLPRRVRFATVWTALAFLIFAVVYGSFDSQIYLFAVWLCCVIWLAFGVQDLLRSAFAVRPRLQIGLMSLLFIALLARIAFVYPAVDASRDTRAADFIAKAAAQIPPGALVFVIGDDEIFSLWYMRFALQQRADLAIVAEGLLQFKWYNQNLKVTYPFMVVPEKDSLQPFDLIVANSNRNICYVSPDVIRCL